MRFRRGVTAKYGRLLLEQSRLIRSDLALESPAAYTVRLLAFSDLHAHPWQPGNAAGRDRVEDCMNCLRAAYHTACLTGTDVMAFLGDLFDSKAALRPDVAARTYAQVRASATGFNQIGRERAGFRESKGVPFLGIGRTVLISGNHDLVRNVSTLGGLVGRGLEDESGLYKAADGIISSVRVGYADAPVQLVCLPWGGVTGQEGERLKGSDVAVGLSHCPVRGARMSRYATEDRGDGLDAVACLPPVVLQGHYHRPQVRLLRGEDGQVRSRIVVVGAPLAHDWSDLDAPDDRGCVLLDVRVVDGRPEEYVLHRVIFDGLPRFLSRAGEARPGVDFALPDRADPPALATGAALLPLADTYDPSALVDAYVRRDRGETGATVPLSGEAAELIDTGIECMTREEDDDGREGEVLAGREGAGAGDGAG